MASAMAAFPDPEDVGEIDFDTMARIFPLMTGGEMRRHPRFHSYHIRLVTILVKLILRADNTWGRILPNGFFVIGHHQMLGLTEDEHTEANTTAVAAFRNAISGDNA